MEARWGLILNIPLAKQKTCDKLVWTGEDIGNFTMKVAISFLQGSSSYLKHQLDNHMEFEYPSQGEDLLLASLQSVSTYHGPLHDKKSSMQSSVSLLLSTCRKLSSFVCRLRICYGMLETCQKRELSWTTNHLSLNNKNFQSLDKNICCLLIMVCQNIQNARNEKVWNNRSLTHQNLVESSKSFLQNWKEVHSKGGGSDQTHEAPAKWTKPHVGWKKMNVDVAADQVKGIMGFGCILEMLRVSLLLQEPFHGEFITLLKKLKLWA